MEFSRQEYQSGFPIPSSGDFPNTGTEPRSPALQAYSLPAEPQEKPHKGEKIVLLTYISQLSQSGEYQCAPKNF